MTHSKWFDGVLKARFSQTAKLCTRIHQDKKEKLKKVRQSTGNPAKNVSA